MQQRNSNLRELPVAPGNTDMNSGFPASNVRPVAKATQGLRPGQSTQPIPVGGRGRGQVAAKTELQPGGEGSTTFRKETQTAQSSTAPQVSLLTVKLKIKNIIIIIIVIIVIVIVIIIITVIKRGEINILPSWTWILIYVNYVLENFVFITLNYALFLSFVWLPS